MDDWHADDWHADPSLDAEGWHAWYATYLRSPAWHRRRAYVMERSGGRCELCWEQPAAEVHHLSYRRAGHEPPHHLIALCEDCHRARHPDKPVPTVYTRSTAPPDLR